MRPDVKLGVVTSLVVVLVAGGYYLYRDRGEPAIPVEEESLALSATSGDKPPSVPAGEEAVKRASPTTHQARNRRIEPRPAGKMDAGQVPPAGADGSPSVPSGPRKRLQRPARSTSEGVPDAANTAAQPPSRTTTAPEAGASRGPAADDGPEMIEPRPEPVGLKPDESTAAVRSLAGVGPSDRMAEPQSKPSEQTVVQRPGGTPAGDASRLVPPTIGQAPTGSGPSPARANVETHRAQPGDTFASLAMQYYGHEKHTQFLEAQNPHVSDPNRIAVGALIQVPPLPVAVSGGVAQGPAAKAAQPTASGPSGAAAGRTYRVKSGDSFYGVARDVLGDATRWQELFELNKDVVGGDPKRLQVGQVIKLPQA